MKEEFLKILVELVRDYKSRKFLVTVAVVAILTCNTQYNLGLDLPTQLMIVVVTLFYVGLSAYLEAKSK